MEVLNTISSKDFMFFESTKSAFDEIIDALKDDKTNMVGLYGMGGSGKTTLATRLGNEVKEQKIFDKVVKVVVSQTPDIKMIQDQVAESLSIKLEEETEYGRANQLFLRLKDEEKILIILDDVWTKLDLATIGFRFGGYHKGSKIFITTRRQQVCTVMGCQQKIQLDVLNEEEGWSLLKVHAGIGDGSSTLNDVAKEVARECKGLPLAIVAIGRAVRGKDIDEWKLVSQKLRSSKLMEIDDVDVDVYACLKLSYDYLRSDQTKLCFLLCSLFPKDCKIGLEELVRYGMGLDLFPDADLIDEARSQLRVIVSNLKASFLLLDADEDGFVRMHDMVRDVALWIASKGENVFMVKAGMGLKEWPEVGCLEQCTAISLMANQIEALPVSLVCPKLKVLLLNTNEKVVNTKVPSDVFQEIGALKVLTLSFRDISLKSLQFLTNLQTLHLESCKLGDMSSLGKLTGLEILSFRNSDFDELPEELGELSKLRLLDLRNCYELIRIPFNVLRRLSQLEELYIDKGSFSNWEVEGTSTDRSNASLSELNSLSRLIVLQLAIKDECLPKDFTFPKLLRYDISVNGSYNFRILMSSYSTTRTLGITDMKETSLLPFKALYQNLESLGLYNIVGCQNIIPSLDQVGLNELKSLGLIKLQELVCIIDTTQQQVPTIAFSNLLSLTLQGNIHLREICKGVKPPRGFLEKLERIDISSCDSMCSLFPAILLQRLQKLKEVIVTCCNELKEVFQLEGVLCHTEEENMGLLSSLTNLELRQLSELTCIWKEPTQHVSLQSLKYVYVTWCKSLTYLFSLSLARSLLQLESLEVSYCENLEHIVSEMGDDNQGNENRLLLPKLKKLRLEGLANLISCCPESYCSTWPALQELEINDCPNLSTSFTAELETNVMASYKELRILEVDGYDQFWNTALTLLSYSLQNLECLRIINCAIQAVFQLEGLVTDDGQEYKLSLPNLKELQLECLEKLEILCKGPIHTLSLQNLTYLEVNNCHKLRHIFTPTLARNMLQLKDLYIEDCDELEQIIVEDDENNRTLSKDHVQPPLLFPNLRLINVKRCNKLKFVLPVTIARGLQQLQSLFVEEAFQLEEVFRVDDEVDVKEIVLPELLSMFLKTLPSFINFCPLVYHYIFPALTHLQVKECPNIILSVEAQNKSVHAETKALHIGKEDVRAQFPPEPSIEINCFGKDKILETLPPYMGK